MNQTGKLLDYQRSFIAAYDGMPVVYIGDVGTHDGTALVNFGCSDTLLWERVSGHKKEFQMFIGAP